MEMLRPNALPRPREPSNITPRRKKTKSVVFRDWVEYDDGDVSKQEFPERHRREDHGKKGVSTEFWQPSGPQKLVKHGKTMSVIYRLPSSRYPSSKYK